MNLQNTQIKEDPVNIIFQILQNIETPLLSLIMETNKMNGLKLSNSIESSSKEIIFSSSLEIKQMVDQVLEHIKSNQTPVLESEPLIFHIYQSNEQVQSICKNGIDPTRVSKQDITWLLDLEKEVGKNLERKQINLEELSYDLAVSKRQLNRKVQNLLNLTPNKYIRVLKLHRAKQLLDDYQYNTISEVSYAVGYYDTHYFSKLFHQQYGVTPKELLDAKR